MDQFESVRKNKFQSWISTLGEEYSFKKNFDICNFHSTKVGEKIALAGRVTKKRDLGQICFGQIIDNSGSCQFSLKKDITINFDFAVKNIDMGDIIGISGETYHTQTGEYTLNVEKITLLSKCFRNPPEKWSGIKDEETKLRQRYLDLLYNENTRLRLNKRMDITKKIREFFSGKDFTEVETPILQNIASGAAATPFKTHHNALDIDMFLRIAPELFLKRLIVGGYNRIFEIAKCFRNEGMDRTHLQEFTMVEAYETYISYEGLMDLCENLLKSVVSVISPDLKVNDIDFNYIERISYTDILKKMGGVSLENWTSLEELEKVAKEKNIDISDCKGPQATLDRIYKKTCVLKIKNPVLIFDYPESPLAKPSEKKGFSSQFQILVDGQEIIKACLENIDPYKQKENFDKQKNLLEYGDTDVVRTDDDFIEALMYGMAPTGGLGMGIDRLVTILTKDNPEPSIRDVVFFPIVKI